VISCAVAVGTVVFAFVLRRRLARAADVEHELRGALTALGLAVQRRGDAGLTAAYEGQLARVRGALGEARPSRCSLERLLRCSIGAAAPSPPHGGNEDELGWVGGATVAAGPGAVVLGNLIANAAEHGDGSAVVRIEIVNRHRERSVVTYGRYGDDKCPLARGRGLRIAARAARAAGGRLEVRDDGVCFAAAVELPVER
jgi:signal transduction histidine kinase